MICVLIIWFASPKKVPSVHKWLQAHPEALDSIAAWLKANPKSPAISGQAPGRNDPKAEKERGEGVPFYQDKFETYTQTSKYTHYGLSNQAKQVLIDVIKNGKESDLDRKDTVYDSDEQLETRTFDKDEKIDALDTDLNWLNAQVLDIHPHKGVFIKYEGWSDKWSEWVPVWSPRIAKSGTFTQHNPPKKKKS